MPEPSEYVRIEVPRRSLVGVNNALWAAIESLQARIGQGRMAMSDVEYRRNTMPGLSELEIIHHVGVLTHHVSTLYSLRDEVRGKYTRDDDAR